ncbi:hypothetical protein FGO68_gene8512 [Halteria grandinella]|uniref:Uncharacterized protein n=1 Tax=Halteria grandinella TaxID=5974 RepID=A0A8J8NAA9_HALGN|nr:hypothetical protein FGO68_gene8512 [Halteria grandinella]
MKNYSLKIFHHYHNNKNLLSLSSKPMRMLLCMTRHPLKPRKKRNPNLSPNSKREALQQGTLTPRRPICR